MVSSTFGRPTAFRPTPSTCYPPPPPPPLPRDVPCLRNSGPGYQMRTRARIDFIKGGFTNQYETTWIDGLPTYGSANGDPTWQLIYSNSRNIIATFTLTCATQPDTSKRWQMHWAGTYITLAGDFLPWSITTPFVFAYDRSLDGTYNSVELNHPAPGTSPSGWFTLGTWVQFYSVGAPDFRPPS